MEAVYFLHIKTHTYPTAIYRKNKPKKEYLYSLTWGKNYAIDSKEHNKQDIFGSQKECH